MTNFIQIPLKDHYILGAIIGDVVGSVYEWEPVNTRFFNLFDPKCTFTDDTVMTVATMKQLLKSTLDCARHPFGVESITDTYRKFGRKYPSAGYGTMFRKWLMSNEYGPIGSFGNGSGMRISPVGWWADTPEEAAALAINFSVVSHDHPEGIKGAMAIALGVYYGREGECRYSIIKKIEESTGYDLSEQYEHIKERGYKFDATCQGSVPESIISFYHSRDFEDTIVNAICLGGDADTMACMAGAIAEARYGTGSITRRLREFVWEKLPNEFKEIIAEFSDVIKEKESVKKSDNRQAK